MMKKVRCSVSPLKDLFTYPSYEDRPQDHDSTQSEPAQHEPSELESPQVEGSQHDSDADGDTDPMETDDPMPDIAAGETANDEPSFSRSNASVQGRDASERGPDDGVDGRNQDDDDDEEHPDGGDGTNRPPSPARLPPVRSLSDLLI